MNGAVINVIVNENVNDDDSDSSEDEQQLILINKIAFRRRKRRLRIQAYSERLIPQLPDMDFKSHFRMTKATFEVLLNILGPKLAATRIHPHLKVGRPLIEPRKQLMVTLWTLAAPDSYRSICERFGIGKATALSIVRRMIKTLISIRSTVIKWPSDEEAQRSAAYFERQYGFPGVIGAVDGTHIRIDAPREDPEACINRKGYHSVHLQVICQENLKFIHCFAGYPGSVHDNRVFQLSGVQTICTTETRSPNNTHLLGDAAYTNQKHLLVHHKNNGRLTEREINYNTRLSSTRMVVERSIGLLKSRFRMLLDRLPVRRMDLLPEYIMACCVLHNICLLNRDYIEVPLVAPHCNENINENVEINADLRNEGSVKREMIKNGLPQVILKKIAYAFSYGIKELKFVNLSF